MKKVELPWDVDVFFSPEASGVATLAETSLTNFCSAIFNAVFVVEGRFLVPSEFSAGMSSVWLASLLLGGGNSVLEFRLGIPVAVRLPH